jgi:hypothetical protein
MTLPAYDHGLAFEGRIEKLFYGNEERVHVDMEDGAEKRGLLKRGHPGRILAVGSCIDLSNQSVRSNPTAVRIRRMAGRAIRITSRIVFFICGLISLLTGVPYALLRGEDLPVQSEWVIFVAVLAAVGLFSIAVAVLPRSWIAKLCKSERDEERLYSAPLKLLGVLAAIFYVLGLVAFLTPHTWNVSPQLLLAMCPMYLLRMTFDPSPVWIFCVLAPMNAAVYGSLGVMLGCVWLALRRRNYVPAEPL